MKMKALFAFLVLLGASGSAMAQQKNNELGDSYLMGNELKFEMVVHIWGEVRSPGEYRVREHTSLLELISKAGGPTEFSSLGNIRIRRDQPKPVSQSQIENIPADGVRFSANGGYGAHSSLTKGRRTESAPKVMSFNMNDYLKGASSRTVPVLQPGDVVVVSRNNSFRWQTVMRVASQVAIIANVWYYLSSRN